MTTISSKGRRSRRYLWWGLPLLLFALFVVLLWRGALHNFLWQTLAPLSFLGGSSASLEAELASTTAALADRDALYAENVQLKAMLGRQAAVPQILAGVIERPPATPYDTLVIDAGTGDGVVVGDWVSAGGSSVVGSVREVGAHVATVELLSSPGASYQGELLIGATSIPVTLTGQGGGSFTTQVPAGTAAVAGDSVMIAGVTEGLEGIVSAVSAPKGAAFITIYMQLPVDPAALRYVEVWQEQSAH